MNNKIKIIFSALLLVMYTNITYSDAAYLQKFLNYQKWSENLPDYADPSFIEFIANDSPLTKKLREKWLYKLAEKKDFGTYNKYYIPSEDINLQCYSLQARLAFEDESKVIPDITKLWLTGNSQPKACNKVFNILLSDTTTKNQLINARATTALKTNNISLTRYLLKQSEPSQNNKLLLLNIISSNPRKIGMLKPGFLHGELCLYGLKILTKRDPELAVKLYNTKAKKIMSEQQQQEFLAHFALFKLLRNKDDALFWLNKVNKKYYTNALLDLEIRYTIAHKNWQKLITLIDNAKNKDELQLKYWQARAYEALGNEDRAKEIYLDVSMHRNYYGFLASQKLKKKLHYNDEEVIPSKTTLAIYKPIIEQIKQLYSSNKILQASRLINDFSSELDKKERSALAYWIAKELSWNGKSIYICNTKELFNQLALRFPIPHKKIINENAKRRNISLPLIYAIIRQESAFFEKIVSSAGANGLMQIMPTTARIVAKQAKIPYKNHKELMIPSKNISIGAAYLQQLANRFSDNPILMIAAYNAGPKQVNYWLETNPNQDMDIWIETIPWTETRNYIKNVIAFYAIYQYRLYNKSSLDEFAKYF